MGKTFTQVNECGECVGIYETCYHQGECHMVQVDLLTTFYQSFVASWVFISAGLVSSILAGRIADTAAGAAVIASAGHGLAAFVVIAAFGRLGGMFNPAALIVTAWKGKEFHSLLQAFYAFVAITLGARVGYWTLLPLYGSSALVSAIPAYTAGTSSAEGFYAEFLGSFILAIVVLTPRSDVNAALSAGFALFIGMIVAHAYTGGSLNPHRYLGPRIASLAHGNTGGWEAREVFGYTLAPILGFTFAKLLNDYLVQYIYYDAGHDEEAMKTY